MSDGLGILRTFVTAAFGPSAAREPRRAVGIVTMISTLLFTAGVASAQDSAVPSPPDPSVQPVPTEPPPQSPFSLQLNLDCTTAYFYHGIMQEDNGLILQPAAKLTVNLHDRDDVRVDALVGTWNSFQGEKTGAQTRNAFTEYWYETDLFGGLVLTSGAWSLTGTYTFFISPSNAYETIQELDLTAAYDDTDRLGAWAMHPYAMLGIETGVTGSDGFDLDPGIYLEFGVTPGFSFDVGEAPVSITFPASIGLSLQDYYQDATGEDDTFGFAQIGVKGSIPLPVGENYGAWTLTAGVAALFLGDHTAEYNDGDHQQVIGTVGLQIDF